MSFGEKDEAVIKSYLLGELSEDELQALEQRVMCDDEFSEHVLMIEDSIIEDYIDERLKGRARESFEKLLLATPQGGEQLRFTRALKEYASKAKSPESVVKPGRGWWQFSLGTPGWALVAAAIILVAAGVVTWRIYFVESEVDKGLSAMNRAFQGQRPIDARITLLAYAARPDTRGSEREASDALALRQSELTLRDFAEKRPDAKSLHALGCLYLAEEDLDKAIDTLDKALIFDPISAPIHSDLGAAHFEKAKALQQSNPTAADRQFSSCLEHLNRALELDPNLLDARFNRALLYQEMRRLNEALDEWRDYLRKDGASSWADEARVKIREIEDQK